MPASYCQFIQCLLDTGMSPTLLISGQSVLSWFSWALVRWTDSSYPEFSEGCFLAALYFYTTGFVGLILSPFGTTENSSALGLRWVSSYTASSST